MGGVDIPAVGHVVLHAPVGIVVCPDVCQAMVVGTFHVRDVPKEALLRHIQGGDFKEVVDAVFQHHAVLAGTFGSVHHLPDIIQREGGRDFAGNVFALLHGIEHDGRVVHPVCGYVHQVDVRSFAHLFPGILASIISGGLRHSGPLQHALATVRAGLVQVAEGNDADPLLIGEAADGFRATCPQADKADSYGVNGRTGQSDDIALAGRTFGGRDADGGGYFFGLGCLAGQEGQTSGKGQGEGAYSMAELGESVSSHRTGNVCISII